MTAVLSNMMSFEGVFTVQAKGDGAIKTLMADMTDTGDLRCYAAFGEDEMLHTPYQGPALLPRLTGLAIWHLPLIIRSQIDAIKGLLELDGPHLGDAASAWYKNSEQLSTMVMTMAEHTSSGWVSSAMLLQQIATSGGNHTDDDLYKQPEEMDSEMADLWHTAMTLSGSVKSEELMNIDLSLQDVVYRLFHTLGAHVQTTRPVQDKCRCSPEKVSTMLDGLSDEQRDSLADEQGQLVVSCEFCKVERSFDLQQYGS